MRWKVSREIALRVEDLDEITWFVAEFQHCEPKVKEAQEQFDRAKRMVETLFSAQQRMYRLDVALDDQALVRNTEMTAYFLSEARRQDESLALYRNVLASLREALTLFLADTYELDATKAWTLDMDSHTLRYEE
jgi:hypothetical protein